MRRRYFIGLTEVAGIFRNLETGLRELGIEAKFHDLSANPLAYGQETGKRRHGGRTRLLSLANSPPASLRRRLWNALLTVNLLVRLLRGLLLLPVAVARYDVFILAGGGMFLNGHELRLLRALGKDVVVVFTGSDHRPPYLNGIWVRDAQQAGYDRILHDTKRLQARVRRAERWATAIVALPASAQFHTRPFFDFLAIGIPFSAPIGARVPSPGPTEGPVRILHCPTNRASKGSEEIRNAIQQLRLRGLSIEFEEITGQPHQVVLDALERCDFVVDEVYSDTPMAGFATEAAFYGRPAVVGGYLAASDAASRTASVPTLFVAPSEVPNAIERLCRDRALRQDLGSRASAYVRDHCSPRTVAARYLSIVGKTSPAAWLTFPPITYVRGWGLDEDLLRASLTELVRQHGAEALRLDDLPVTRDRLLQLLTSAPG